MYIVDLILHCSVEYLQNYQDTLSTVIFEGPSPRLNGIDTSRSIIAPLRVIKLFTATSICILSNYALILKKSLWTKGLLICSEAVNKSCELSFEILVYHSFQVH